MKICDYLHKDCIVTNLPPQLSKEALFKKLLKIAFQTHNCIDTDEALSGLKKREEMGTTGVGNGVAIPHTGVAFCKEIITVLGTAEKGIEYNSVDNHPVRIILMIMFPKDKIDIQLRFLARVSRILRKEEVKSDLIRSNSAEDVFRALKCYEDVHFS